MGKAQGGHVWAHCRNRSERWGPLLVFSPSPLCLVLAIKDLSQQNTSVRWNERPEQSQGQQRYLTSVPVMETKCRKSLPGYSCAHRGGAKRINGLVQCGLPIGKNISQPIKGTHAPTWMKLEDSVLSEISQSQWTNTVEFHLCEVPKISESYRRGGWEGEDERCAYLEPQPLGHWGKMAKSRLAGTPALSFRIVISTTVDVSKSLFYTLMQR